MESTLTIEIDEFVPRAKIDEFESESEAAHLTVGLGVRVPRE